MALEDALLDILVCPIDKRGLLYFADDAVLYNPRLRWLYRIEDGIPLMLANAAHAGQMTGQVPVSGGAGQLFEDSVGQVRR